MDDIGHTDLHSVFSELEMSADWNSSPGKAATAIANLHGFYVKILRLCRNGVLPRERMRTALCNLDGRQDIFGVRHYKWNFDSRPTPVVAQNICETIRVGSSKLRELKQSGKKYVHAMIGQSKDNAELINELIDMITLANSPNTEAMVVARQFSHVDDTGCCMEIFDRVLEGALTRPLRDESDNESLVEQGPGAELMDTRSSQGVATTCLDSQTTAENEDSAGTPGPAKLEPEGVDTAHAGLTNVVADGSIFNTSRVAEQPPVTPQSKPSCTIGIELDRPSTEKTEDAGKLGPDDTRPLEDFGKSSVPAIIDTWMSQDRSKKGTPRKMIDTWKRNIVCTKLKVKKPVSKKGKRVSKAAARNPFPSLGKILATVSMESKDPKRNFMRKVYRSAVTNGNLSGWSIGVSRHHGLNCSDKARRYFEKNVEIKGHRCTLRGYPKSCERSRVTAQFKRSVRDIHPKSCERSRVMAQFKRSSRDLRRS